MVLKKKVEQEIGLNEYLGAVLSTEIRELLRSPPLSLDENTADEYQDHLIVMGLLVEHYIDRDYCPASIIQFRI